MRSFDLIGAEPATTDWTQRLGLAHGQSQISAAPASSQGPESRTQKAAFAVGGFALALGIAAVPLVAGVYLVRYILRDK